jgi:plasmid stabilization system protein ParE
LPSQIILTDAAKLAIIEQWEYYDTRQGIELATRWELAAGVAIESLREGSERGARCAFPNGSLTGLRWIRIKGFPYRIFYIHERAANLTVIVRIFHEKRDIADLLESALRDL